MTSVERWRSVWRELGESKADDELYQRLVARYAEPHRKYHTIQHLNECFTHFDSVKSWAEHAAEVELERRERIYSTEVFRSEYEARARENLTRSLSRL